MIIIQNLLLLKKIKKISRDANPLELPLGSPCRQNAKNPGQSRGFVPEGRAARTMLTPMHAVHSTLMRLAGGVSKSAA